MSPAKVFPRFQIRPARISTTAFAGLPLFARLAESVGLIPALQQRLHFLKRRQRGYSVWQSVLSLILLSIADGDGASPKAGSDHSSRHQWSQRHGC